MFKYLFSKLLSKFVSDERLISISQNLVNTIIGNAGTTSKDKSLMIISVKDIMLINNHRFVRFNANNVSLDKYEVLICDIGIICMSIINKSFFKDFNGTKYSVYIKEI